MEEKESANMERINHTVKSVEGHRSALMERLNTVKTALNHRSVLTLNVSVTVKSVTQHINSIDIFS